MKNSRNKDLLSQTTEVLLAANSNVGDVVEPDGSRTINYHEILKVQLGVVGYKPMRNGIYSSLDTYMEDFSILDNDDTEKLYNLVFLINEMHEIIRKEKLTKKTDRQNENKIKTEVGCEHSAKSGKWFV